MISQVSYNPYICTNPSLVFKGCYTTSHEDIKICQEFVNTDVKSKSGNIIIYSKSIIKGGIEAINGNISVINSKVKGHIKSANKTYLENSDINSIETKPSNLILEGNNNIENLIFKEDSGAINFLVERGNKIKNVKFDTKTKGTLFVENGATVDFVENGNIRKI